METTANSFGKLNPLCTLEMPEVELAIMELDASLECLICCERDLLGCAFEDGGKV
jgi:hypothetical protein